eukprot:1161246-Pelagomonas_calceolata.AAC.4
MLVCTHLIEFLWTVACNASEYAGGAGVEAGTAGQRSNSDPRHSSHPVAKMELRPHPSLNHKGRNVNISVRTDNGKPSLSCSLAATGVGGKQHAQQRQSTSVMECRMLRWERQCTFALPCKQGNAPLSLMNWVMDCDPFFGSKPGVECHRLLRARAHATRQ